jgi:hypothetical protein
MIIGERPAPDLIECMHCRRRWDASLLETNQCIVCNTEWDGPPEWDQSAVIRKLWIIESRWRIGGGHGMWQYVDQVPFEHGSDDINAILDRYRNAENKRLTRHRPLMWFEYRAVDKLIEVLGNRVA